MLKDKNTCYDGIVTSPFVGVSAVPSATIRISRVTTNT